MYREGLLILAIVLIALGAILEYAVPIGELSYAGHIILIIGIIVLIIWVILIVIDTIRGRS